MSQVVRRCAQAYLGNSGSATLLNQRLVSNMAASASNEFRSVGSRSLPWMDVLKPAAQGLRSGLLRRFGSGAGTWTSQVSLRVNLCYKCNNGDV